MPFRSYIIGEMSKTKKLFINRNYIVFYKKIQKLCVTVIQFIMLKVKTC